jgi:hypothetical protein
MYLDEAERPLYDPHREAWIRWAFLTSVLLALAAALSAWGAASWGAQTWANALAQQRHWANYHALTGKTEAHDASRIFLQVHQLLEHKNPKLQKFIEEKLRDQEKELTGLEEEWEQFKAASENLEIAGERAARRAAGSARTAFMLMLGAGLAALGGVGKKKLLWLVALILAAGGAVSFLGALFLGW